MFLDKSGLTFPTDGNANKFQNFAAQLFLHESDDFIPFCVGFVYFQIFRYPI